MKKQNYLFDDPKHVRLLIRLLFVICTVLFTLDFFIHRHISHPFEAFLGFYPVFGFIGCVLLVIIAKWMRTFLMRPDSYYASGKNRKPGTQKTNIKSGANHVDS